MCFEIYVFKAIKSDRRIVEKRMKSYIFAVKLNNKMLCIFYGIVSLAQEVHRQ